MSAASWEEVCKKKKASQAASIPRDWLLPSPPDESVTNVLDIPRSCGLLTPKELDITALDDVDVLLSKLALGEWTSVEVTTAFYKRAIIAQQLTNCLTEIFVEQALERARWLDGYLAEHGQPVGPLHGLPISLKDQFCIKGLETVMGYAAWVGRVAEKNCVLVEILNQLGAVPFVRTNVPQTLWWGETFNHVFGRTVNPHNRHLTPGGSSGGEGALNAMRGAPLGVGTDIGGSIRIPSSWCGLYGFRPSYNRLPYQDALNTGEGQETIPSVLGPLSSSFNGLRTFAKAIIDAKPWDWDPIVVRKDWDEKAERLEGHGRGKGMCFAIVEDDGMVKVQPPIRRALGIVRAALEKAGHKVIKWEPYLTVELRDVMTRIFVADAGEDLLAQTERIPPYEPLLKSMRPGPPTTPEQIASHLGSTEPIDESFTYATFQPQKPLTVTELYAVHVEKRKLVKAFLDHWIQTKDVTGTGRPVDGIIGPVMSSVAPRHGENAYDFYAELWNIVDSPSVAFPVTTVSSALDTKPAPHTFRTPEDKIVYNIYDPQFFAGAPVGLQIVGRKLEDEAVLGMAKVVVEALKSTAA